MKRQGTRQHGMKHQQALPTLAPVRTMPHHPALLCACHNLRNA